MSIDKKNAEGYPDPTAYEAITAVRREEIKKARPYRPLVYICSPFAGDTEVNVEKALQYCRFTLDKGCFPIAPHCYLPRFMDDGNPAERELGVLFGLRLLHECRALWLFGSRISEGMRREIIAANRSGIPIKHFTENMEEL